MNIAMEQTEVFRALRRELSDADPCTPLHQVHGPWHEPVWLASQEYVHGQLKNKYGDCFIRGNNGAQRLHLMPQLDRSLDVLMRLYSNLCLK